MIKRKHRVCVEITLEKPSTTKKAVYLVSVALDATNSDGWQYDVTKFECKSFDRVVRALR